MSKRIYVFCLVAMLGMLLIVTNSMAQTRRGVTDDTIKLGVMLGLSGQAAILGQNLGAAIEAYYAWVNDTGGINGRKVKLFTEDNGWEPAVALAGAKKLISQDQVLAFVNSFGTAPTHGIFNFVETERVPTLPYSYSRTMHVPLKRYVFNFLTSYNFIGGGEVDYIVKDLKDSKPKIGVITVEGDAGNDYRDGALSAAKHYGFDIAAVQRFPQNAVDYSSQVLNLKRADVKYVMMMGSPEQSGTILNEIAKLGWNPIFVFNDAAWSTKLPQLAPTVKGAYMVSVQYDYNEDVPPMKRVREIVEKYSKFKPSAASFLVGWSCAEIMTAALKKAGRDLSVESLLRSLESLKDEPMSAIGPVTFSPTKHSSGDTLRIVQIDPSQRVLFKPVTDWRKTTSVSD